MRKASLLLLAIVLMTICSACGAGPALPESSKGGESAIESAESKPVSSETFSSNPVSSKNVTSKIVSSKKSSSKSIGSKISSNEKTSSKTFRSIDEVPPIVLDGDPVPFVIAYHYTGYGGGSTAKNNIYLITSHTQYIDIMQKHFDGELDNKYDDVFFQNKALILTELGYPYGPLTVKEDSLIKKNNGELVFNVRVKGGRTGLNGSKVLCATTYYRSWLEISNADISGVTNVSYTIYDLK